MEFWKEGRQDDSTPLSIKNPYSSTNWGRQSHQDLKFLPTFTSCWPFRVLLNTPYNRKLLKTQREIRVESWRS